jgi:hypothetical protein
MVITYKILSDKDANYSAQWFEKMDTRRPTRYNSGLNNLIAGRAGHNFRREFFSQRVPLVWNVLPDTVKEASTAAAFKSRYRLFNEDRVARRKCANGEAAREEALQHCTDILIRGLPGPQRIISQVYK